MNGARAGKQAHKGEKERDQDDGDKLRNNGCGARVSTVGLDILRVLSVLKKRFFFQRLVALSAQLLAVLSRCSLLNLVVGERPVVR